MLILRLTLALVRLLLLLLLLSVPTLRRLLAALLVLRRSLLVLVLVLATSIATAVLHGHDIGAFVERLMELANVTGHVLVAGNGKGNERLVRAAL